MTLQPPKKDAPPFIGRIESISNDTKEGLQIRVAWYYRPEEAAGGRKAFHSEREIFFSDHFDWVGAQSINGKCQVHTLQAYQKLQAVTASDFFARFSYKAKTGQFRPDRVPVYCICEMPYNPDLFMIECDNCREWYHPECIGRERQEVEAEPSFVCQECQAGPPPGGHHGAGAAGSDGDEEGGAEGAARGGGGKRPRLS